MAIEKQFKAYEVKSIPFVLKDLDEGSRQVKIALSAFDVIDSDHDIIRKGAFAKSISERGPDSSGNRKIAFMRYHNWEHEVGKFLELAETNTHLEAVGQMGNSTKGSDALADYQDGIIREHSIGFNYVSGKIKFIEEEGISPIDGFWEISEVDLWEGSAVAFGANELTPVLDVAKGNREDAIKELNKKMNTLVAALKNGKGTDERLFSIEIGLKNIQEQYNSLLKAQPGSEKPTVDKDELRDQDKKNYLKTLLTQ